MKIKKTEILLLLFSSSLALVLSLILIRWLQPSLLGVSNDMVLVESNEEIIPYYENIFNEQDFLSDEFIIKDPLVKGRAKQLFPDEDTYGPHDILGFRNKMVPNRADVVIIGDSQTYGLNAHMIDNWPHFFTTFLPDGTTVYSMATGGWGAAQYYYAATKAPYFSPKVVIIAFYTGNDPLETFSMVYGSDDWAKFKSVRNLDKNNIPKFNFPVPEDEQWPVTFSDDIKTIFTPALRHASNKQHPAVDAAYKSIIKIAENIVYGNDIHVVFTIIPTKELVYSRKIEKDNIEIDPSYKALIEDEKIRINELSKALQSVNKARYIHIIDELQLAALSNIKLYPSGIDGHPVAEGYKVIGKAIATELSDLFKMKVTNGLAIVKTAEGNRDILVYVEGIRYWLVNMSDENETFEKIVVSQIIKKHELNGFYYMGYKEISDVSAE
jgi:hypothetical protein